MTLLQTNIAVYRVLCTPRTRLGIRRESLTKAGQNWTSRLPNTGCTDTDVMFGFVFVLLTVSLSVGSGDYPPHELEYRIHPIDLYPREATHSVFCQSRSDGNYPHNELDLGDPRCTFVMCTNKRTVVHSCPRGTRTGRFYLPEYYPKAFYLAGKYGKYRKYGPDFRSLEVRFREDFRNHKSTHGICDYFDVGGVCGALYPDYNAFIRDDSANLRY